MEAIIKANSGNHPFKELKKFINGDYLIQDTHMGRVLAIHGTKDKSKSLKRFTFLKHHISLKNVDYILTCYPKTMIKLMKELDIDLKNAKVLFPRHNKETWTHYGYVQHGDVLAGYGKTPKAAKRAQRKAIKVYNKRYNTSYNQNNKEV